MDIYQAIVLGIVEGLTEFLPVSSTGHLILAAHLMGISQNGFTKSFEISIQLGSISAVFFLYLNRLLRDWEVWKRIWMAFLPTGFLGFFFYRFIKTYLIGNDKVVVASLVIGGVLLLFADRFCQRFCYIGDVKDISLKRAFFIGLFQSLAMIPGLSRSASTIIGGMLLGLHRRSAAEFSFMLAIPTMLIATAYDLYKSHQSYTGNDWYTLSIGFLVAFVSATITVKAFLGFVSKHSFLPFGVYRIVVGFVYAFFFI